MQAAAARPCPTEDASAVRLRWVPSPRWRLTKKAPAVLGWTEATCDAAEAAEATTSGPLRGVGSSAVGRRSARARTLPLARRRAAQRRARRCNRPPLCRARERARLCSDPTPYPPHDGATSEPLAPLPSPTAHSRSKAPNGRLRHHPGGAWGWAERSRGYRRAPSSANGRGRARSVSPPSRGRAGRFKWALAWAHRRRAHRGPGRCRAPCSSPGWCSSRRRHTACGSSRLCR